MKKLDVKETAYVKYRIEGMGKGEAAIKAGWSKKTAHSMATKIERRPHVRAAIDRRMRKIGKRNDVTEDNFLRLLFENYDSALDKGNLSAANKTLELVGKLCGLFTEQISVNTDYNIPEAVKELLNKAERFKEEKVSGAQIIHLKDKQKVALGDN